MIRIIKRTVIYLSIFSFSLFLFYFFATFQQYMDSTISFILLCLNTLCLLNAFCSVAGIISVFAGLIKNKKSSVLFLLILYAFSIVESTFLFAFATFIIS